MRYDKHWYDSLNKPGFTPPEWVFAPVWTVIYILMFVSFGLVFVAKFQWLSVVAYLLFFVQIGVNLSWSPAFFEQHNLRKAFGLSVLLALLIFLMMIVFFYISKWAGVLLIPYFVWCIFASVLSFEILELNEW